MTRDTFLETVKERAYLDDNDAAKKATQATLEVLGKRLFGGEATDLAAQLPDGIKEYLIPAEATTSFGAEEFVSMVADREEVDKGTARLHAKAVLSVLSEAVSGGEMKDIKSQLPEDYAALFKNPAPS